MQQGERVHFTQCGWILTAKWCTYILALGVNDYLIKYQKKTLP